ncbi:MAG TPA: hypothetical protein VHZ95_20795, partial [Polyangiales bacterium]|nr:hypothetical protein [Polyangiales bacterium]
MIAAFALLLGAAVVIYLSCEFFVNGVEWVGRRAGVGQTAVGTVLAAFGTALPESVVTLVAVAFSKHADGKAIGIGAALGGPLALATIAYPVVGAGLWISGRASAREVSFDSQRLARDQGWFLVIFVVKVALGLVAFAGKSWLGLAFLSAYCVYVWLEMSHDEDEGEGELEPLKLRPSLVEPSLLWALLQTTLALL